METNDVKVVLIVAFTIVLLATCFSSCCVMVSKNNKHIMIERAKAGQVRTRKVLDGCVYIVWENKK